MTWCVDCGRSGLRFRETDPFDEACRYCGGDVMVCHYATLRQAQTVLDEHRKQNRSSYSPPLSPGLPIKSHYVNFSSASNSFLFNHLDEIRGLRQAGQGLPTTTSLGYPGKSLPGARRPPAVPGRVPPPLQRQAGPPPPATTHQTRSATPPAHHRPGRPRKKNDPGHDQNAMEPRAGFSPVAHRRMTPQ